MCGISGIWRFNEQRINEEEIAQFNDTLAHRGPDGSGTYTDHNLALGHRRLSIIDLSAAGKQPMKSHDSDLVITYNGEIFNYKELREELAAKGHRFNTHTDTEVILAAYKEWSEDCFLRFNGMWALAIWNTKTQTLFLCRDRFGIKPLYYVYIPGQFFAFASESVSFAKLPGFKKEIDEKNLALGLRNIYYLESAGKTIYKNINKLRAGHNLVIHKDSPAPLIKQWWDTLKHKVSFPGTYTEQVVSFKQLFTDSCRLRLRSDVPVGITLSGGLDSSSVYAAIREIYNHRLQDKENAPQEFPSAFIASFPGTTIDEKRYADQVLQYYNGKAAYIYPHEENISDAIIAEVKHEDFIYLTPPVMYNIYKAIRQKGIKVSMDGHGVDEMLFGYPRMIRDWILKSNKQDAMRLFLLFADMRNEGDNLAMKTFKESYKVLKGHLAKKTSGENNTENWLKEKFDFVAEHHSEPVFNKAADEIAYRNFHEISLPTILRNCDRASMRHGVEIRMPFMDWRIVTYIFSLPADSKVKHGYTKRILRDAMQGMLPENIRTRKYKLGINAPMIEWFNGPMSAFIIDAVQSASFMQSSIWNGPLLKDIALKLTTGKKWTQRDCDNFWPYLNAWILMN